MRFSSRYSAFILVIALNAMLTSSLRAEMRVVSHISDQWAMENGEGFANEMFRRLSTLTGVSAELEVYPVNYAANLLLTHKVDCYFGGTVEVIKKYPRLENLDLIESKTITGDSMYAFTKKSTPKIQNFKQLAEKSIVATSATFKRLEQLIPTDVYSTLSLTEIDTLSQGVRLVDANRADVFIRYRSTLTNEFSNRFHFDRNFSIFSTKDKIVCQRSEVNAAYLNGINKAIDIGVKSGSLNDVYNKYQRMSPNELE